MSVQQKHQPSSNTTEKSDLSTQQTSLHSKTEPSIDNSQQAKHPIQRLLQWLRDHSFSPSWLPKNLHHPLIGYLVALFLQLIAVFMTTLLVQFYPSFTFTGLLDVLAIALVALNWGAGPSLFATFIGVVMLNYAVLPPQFGWAVDTKSLVELLLFLLVGFTISIVASRIESTRRNAESLATSLVTERARLEAVIEAVPDAVSIHDTQGTIVRLNKLGLQNTGAERSNDSMPDAQRTFAVKTPTGEMLPLEDFPVARALRGETVSAFELSFLAPDGQERFASISAAPLHDAQGSIDGAILVTHDVTRLYQSEREAATRANELEAIFETMTDSIFVFNSHGQMLRMNAAARALFRLDESPAYYSRLINEHRYNFAPLDEQGRPLPEEQWPLHRVLKGETLTSTRALDVRLRSRDGEEFFVNVSGAPMRNKAGEIIGAVCICHDITDQRQMEQRIRESERVAAERASEFEAIFEAITDGVFVLSTDRQIVRMNSAFRELLGLSEELGPAYYSHSQEERRSLLALSDEQGRLLPYEQWPESRILRGEVLKGSNAADIMFHALDGRTLELSVSGAPVHNKDGQLVGALCICRDVTERRQLERRTQDTLNALLAMAEALVLVPDNSAAVTGQLTPAAFERPPQTSIHRIAHRMAELTCSVLGCRRVSISAVEPATEILHPIAIVGLSPEQEGQWWAEQQQQQTLLGEGLPPELASRLAAHEVLLLNMMEPPFNAVPNPYNIRLLLIAPMSIGDQTVGLLALDYGGAEHVYSQEEIALAKTVARLSALVIERERLLRERAEARATELALREANRRMDEFLGMTSHELKTPLTSIKGNTQLTARQLKNSLQSIEKMQNMLESTERQIKLLDRLVDDLLDISRTQSNQLELHTDICDLATVVREAVEEQRRTWPTRSITLNILSDSLEPLSADSDRVKQVLMNYLTNALKYSASDRPVHVTVQQEVGQVRVAVKDEGVGLSSDEQAHVWERFHRASGVEVQSTSQTSMMGLGLGLYICKTIIEQHHGSVGVESTPHVGSTFWFTLPTGEQEENSQE